jgi:hypothetical protein
MCYSKNSSQTITQNKKFSMAIAWWHQKEYVLNYDGLLLLVYNINDDMRVSIMFYFSRKRKIEWI